MSEHRLIKGTLVRTAYGIVADCVCGWTSGPRVSSMVASVAMQDHREAEAAKKHEGVPYTPIIGCECVRCIDAFFRPDLDSIRRG